MLDTGLGYIFRFACLEPIFTPISPMRLAMIWTRPPFPISALLVSGAPRESQAPHQVRGDENERTEFRSINGWRSANQAQRRNSLVSLDIGVLVAHQQRKLPFRIRHGCEKTAIWGSIGRAPLGRYFAGTWATGSWWMSERCTSFIARRNVLRWAKL